MAVSAPPEVILEFQRIRKVFQKGSRPVEAVADISLSVGRGEFVAVVGPSGCGKSTLLNMAAGLMLPTNGSITYQGSPVSGPNRAVGYVTQRDNLLPWRKVRDNVGVGLELRGVPRGERDARVREMIERVGLAGFEDHYPSELSGGMRKRVTIARTLIYEPETLLMDEPFGSLDAQLKLILQQELLRLWEGSSRSILFITHDLAEAVALADRVVVITARPGRVKLVQDVDLPRPRDAFSVRFDTKFAELNETIWNTMRDDIGRGEQN